MNGDFVPGIILDASNWSVDNFVSYEKSSFLPALIQFLHRSLAYVLIISGLYYFYITFFNRENSILKPGIILLVSMLGIQVLLGIFTVVNCLGSVPLFLGVMHQFVAILLLSVSLYLNYLSVKDTSY